MAELSDGERRWKRKEEECRMRKMRIQRQKKRRGLKRERLSAEKYVDEE